MFLILRLFLDDLGMRLPMFLILRLFLDDLGMRLPMFLILRLFLDDLGMRLPMFRVQNTTWVFLCSVNSSAFCLAVTNGKVSLV